MRGAPDRRRARATDTSQPRAAKVNRFEKIDATQKNDADGATSSASPTSHGYSGKNPALAAATGSSGAAAYPSRATRSYQTASHFCQTASGLRAVGTGDLEGSLVDEEGRADQADGQNHGARGGQPERGGRPGAGGGHFRPDRFGATRFYATGRSGIEIRARAGTGVQMRPVVNIWRYGVARRHNMS